MKWKPWIWIALLLTVTVVLVVRGLRPKPVLVEAAAVERGPLAITIEEEGKTRVADRYVISAPVAGFLRRIALDVGDVVREGMAISRLTPMQPVFIDTRSRAETEARIAAAEAAERTAAEQVRVAEANASLARTQLARFRKLVDSGDLAGEVLDRAKAEADSAAAALSAARYAVEQARNTAEALRATLQRDAAPANPAPPESVPVIAPVSGRVLRVVRKSEGVVQAGEPLVEVANAQALEVEVELLSADAVRVRPGTRVEFVRWGGEGPLEGRVRRIEPTAFTKISALGVEEQRVRVLIDFTSPRQQWERLGDGYRVEARFFLWESADVLLAPATALFPHGGGWAVFVVEQETARRRAVSIGKRNGLAGEILDGLQEGERVVLHPDTSVADGVLVTTEKPDVR